MTTEHGFTLIELLIVVFVIGALAAIAVPSMLRARLSANEVSAIASVRTINSAQASYSATAGSGGYATGLAILGSPCPASTSVFLGPDLASDPVDKSGYRIRLQAAAGAAAGPNDCNSLPTSTLYYSTAVPVSGGISGQRAFASNASGTVFFDASGVAPTEAAISAGTALTIQ